MEVKDNIQKDGLQDLLRSLPVEKPADGLNAKIMEQVRRSKSYAERRSERRFLACAVVLSAVVLGAGIRALYTYLDWKTLIPEQPFHRAPAPEKLLTDVIPKISPEAAGFFKVLLPFAGIILLLLLGDLLFRCYFFLKHHRQDS